MPQISKHRVNQIVDLIVRVAQSMILRDAISVPRRFPLGSPLLSAGADSQDQSHQREYVLLDY